MNVRDEVSRTRVGLVRILAPTVISSCCRATLSRVVAATLSCRLTIIAA